MTNPERRLSNASLTGLALAAAMAVAAPQASSAQSRLALPFPVDSFPNVVAVGFGTVPDYLGSDEYTFGGAPAARIDLGYVDFRLLGNWAMLDVLTNSQFSLGPAGVLRFGRKDVDDAVVGLLPDIDMTVELGLGFGYEFVDDEDPLKRLSVGVDVLHDVGGVHDGFVGSVYARAVYPLWWRGGAIVGSLGATLVDDDYSDTYFSVNPADSVASGLPAFNAGGGARDVRLGLGISQSLSKHWHVGVGALYMRMVGDAGDSPIVDQRGSKDQFIAGLGFAYAWGFDD